jgi:cytochrome d ubiquinol oxidase subunit II
MLTGALFVLLFLTHGSLYVCVKTEGDLCDRSSTTAGKLWPALLLVAVVFLVSTAFVTKLYDNYLATMPLLAVPMVAVVALIGIKVFLAKGKPLAAFTSSCVTIVMVVFTGVIGLFPNLIPSSLDPVHSLTIYNSSSSPYTLKIMTVVALVFVPIVIAYKIWVYRVFRSTVTADTVMKNEQAY